MGQLKNKDDWKQPEDKNQIVLHDDGSLYIRQGTSYYDNGRNHWEYQAVILNEKSVAKLKKLLAPIV